MYKAKSPLSDTNWVTEPIITASRRLTPAAARSWFPRVYHGDAMGRALRSCEALPRTCSSWRVVLLPLRPILKQVDVLVCHGGCKVSRWACSWILPTSSIFLLEFPHWSIRVTWLIVGRNVRMNELKLLIFIQLWWCTNAFVVSMSARPKQEVTFGGWIHHSWDASVDATRISHHICNVLKVGGNCTFGCRRDDNFALHNTHQLDPTKELRRSQNIVNEWKKIWRWMFYWRGGWRGDKWLRWHLAGATAEFVSPGASFFNVIKATKKETLLHYSRLLLSPHHTMSASITTHHSSQEVII